MITTDPWDWSLEVDAPVREQLATICYWNNRDELVIRQKADLYDEGDTLVLLAPESVKPLAMAMLAAIVDRPDRQQDDLTHPTSSPVVNDPAPPGPLLVAMGST